MYRLLTYNVRHCLGADGHVSPARIARVIADCRPNIVALQELDVTRRRTGGVDQAQAIAQELRMHSHFHPAMSVETELYGDAILTDQPARLVKAGALPGARWLEPRGALWVSLSMSGTHVDVINTHLGLRTQERLRQAEALLGPDWAGACRNPLLLAGDLNAVPQSRVYRRFASKLRDAQAGRPGRAAATFPSRLPLLRLDHVFASKEIEILRVDIVRTPLAREASDHLPLLVEFRVAGQRAA